MMLNACGRHFGSPIVKMRCLHPGRKVSFDQIFQNFPMPSGAASCSLCWRSGPRWQDVFLHAGSQNTYSTGANAEVKGWKRRTQWRSVFFDAGAWAKEANGLVSCLCQFSACWMGSSKSPVWDCKVWGLETGGWHKGTVDLLKCDTGIDETCSTR